MRKLIPVLLGVILTAQLGRITYDGHMETYYNLNMRYVCKRAAENGIQLDYWVRADGVKMIGPYVIVAADWNIHPYGSEVETSRGTGLVLDTGDFTKDDPSTVDIAVTW